MMQYLRSRLPDWLLCTLMSAALSSAVCSGFEMTSPGKDSVIALFAAAAVMSLIMTALAYRRVLTGLGIAAGVVIAVASVAYLKTVHPLADEAAHAGFIFALVCIIAGILVFLLSRSRFGIVVLFIAGNLIGAGAHFLQFENPLWSFLLFTAAVLVMFFYRVYIISLMNADMGRVRTGKYMTQTVAVCLAAALLASGIFAGIVRPLDPPTHDLKLIRVLKQMEMLEALGIYNVKTVLDPFKDSSSAPDQSEYSNQKGNEQNETMDGQDEDQQQEENDDAVTDPSLQIKADAIKYAFKEYHLGWIIPLAIILILAAAVAYVMSRRRRWRRAVQELSNEELILNYYAYFIRCIAIAGIKKPSQQTLREFAQSSSHELEVFAVNTGGGDDAEGAEKYSGMSADAITFGQISDIYERVLYGGMNASDEEREIFESFYDGLAVGLKKRMGLFKYLLNYIRF